MFLGMQAALYYHARTVAIAAAQEGARAAGGEHGTRSRRHRGRRRVRRRRRRRRRTRSAPTVDGDPHGDHRDRHRRPATASASSPAGRPSVRQTRQRARREAHRTMRRCGRTTTRVGRHRGGDRRARLRAVRRAHHLRRPYGDRPPGRRVGRRRRCPLGLDRTHDASGRASRRTARPPRRAWPTRTCTASTSTSPSTPSRSAQPVGRERHRRASPSNAASTSPTCRCPASPAAASSVPTMTSPARHVAGALMTDADARSAARSASGWSHAAS